MAVRSEPDHGWMSEAVFGLVGVVVGALAAGLGDYLLEARREVRSIRKAARMLLLELQEAKEFIEISLEKLVWIAEPERVLSNEVWCTYRAEFAAVKSHGLWEDVSQAFLAIAEVRRNNLGASAGTSLIPGDERAEDAASVLPGVERAFDGLAKYLD